jgi:Flp pilus assembly protein TadG
MKTTQKGSAAVIFVIVILILLIAGAVFAYRSVANEEAAAMVPTVDTSSQQASVPAVVEAAPTDSVDDISADIDASLTTSDEDLNAMNSEFKK